MDAPRSGRLEQWGDVRGGSAVALWLAGEVHLQINESAIPAGREAFNFLEASDSRNHASAGRDGANLARLQIANEMPRSLRLSLIHI